MVEYAMDTETLLRICKEWNGSCAPDPLVASPLDTYPHMFLFSCMMSRQMPALSGWHIPFVIAEDLVSKGILETAKEPRFEAFASMDENYYLDLFESRSLHKYNRQMSHFLFSAIRRIEEQYDSDASRIWSDDPNSACLIGRLLEFDGIGVTSANMMAGMLVDEYHIELSDYSAIDVMTDIHIKRTFCRLGILEIPPSGDINDLDPDIVVYKAKELSPSFPGLLDHPFWEPGVRRICKNDSCNAMSAKDCGFFDVCPRIGLPKTKQMRFDTD